MASPDARAHLESLIGRTVFTVARRRPNIILGVDDGEVHVRTERSKGRGEKVAIADVQATFDRVWDGEEVPIHPRSVGYRSAFIGAVLASMPDVETLEDPWRVRLRHQPNPDVRIRNPAWEYDELVLALDLYLRRGIPPVSDSEVGELSALLNRLPLHPTRPDEQRFRNPNAVHMKLANFRGVDPRQPGRGLAAGGRGVAEVWERFANDPEGLRGAVTQIRAAGTSDGPGIHPEQDEAEAVEGRILFRAHRMRERDPSLVKRKKASVQQRLGRLPCEACDMDFADRYGELGAGFIECHHKLPLAAGETRTTTINDLALVCPNCHRMLHRARPPLTVEQLRELVRRG